MKILVVSDVHANLPALIAVLDAAPPYDAIWNLGDTTGYGARPNECLDRLAEEGAQPSLVGNHDLAAVGLLPIKWFNAYAATAAGWTSMQLTESNIFRIRSSYTSESLGQYFLVHGSPRDPARDYIQTLDDASAALAMVAAGCILCGHTHVPMLAIERQNGRLGLNKLQENEPFDLRGHRALLNPGSVGQPRDGDPRASYLMLDTDESTAVWKRTAYDVEQAQQEILAAGLPKELASRLARGR